VATFVLVAQNLRVGSEATKGRSEWIVLESQFKCPAGCTRRWHTKIGGTQGGPNPVIKDLEHSIWRNSPLNSLKLKGSFIKILKEIQHFEKNVAFNFFIT